MMYMNELSITTPALLFSAISLIFLAYTNRFLGYAQLVRNLYEKFKINPDTVLKAQISNLRKRLRLTRLMQVLGVTSLFMCVVSMFLVYVSVQVGATFTFGIAILLLLASLAVSLYEIQISVGALDLHLNDMEGIDKIKTKRN